MSIRWVRHGGDVLGCVVSGSHEPDQTTFVTPDTFIQQLGFIVYPEGGQVLPHVHRPFLRSIDRTAEVVLVWRGRCTVDFYTDAGAIVESFELCQGDLVLLVAGGHGFRMIEATVLMEVKQGPYAGADDKVRFDPAGGPRSG